LRFCPLIYRAAGKPIENAYIESFNGNFRDECLNEHSFVSLADATSVIEAWRIDYNAVARTQTSHYPCSGFWRQITGASLSLEGELTRFVVESSAPRCPAGERHRHARAQHERGGVGILRGDGAAEAAVDRD
jgi:Integrase core domain